MSTCPTCGAPASERASRGPLTTQTDPVGAWWRGRPLPIVGYQHAILHLLCQRGTASYLAVQLVGSGEDANPEVVTTVIAQLRRKLPDGLAIRNMRGHGYTLEVEDTMSIKDKLRAEIEAMPDDAKAALVIIAPKEGGLRMVGPGGNAPQTMALLGAAVSATASRLVPAPVAGG